MIQRGPNKRATAGARVDPGRGGFEFEVFSPTASSAPPPPPPQEFLAATLVASTAHALSIGEAAAKKPSLRLSVSWVVLASGALATAATPVADAVVP